MAFLRFSGLSAPRHALIRQCQLIAFGTIGPFSVRDCDPVLTGETEVLVDVKLDGAKPIWSAGFLL
jgi:hypothetical protein